MELYNAVGNDDIEKVKRCLSEGQLPIENIEYDAANLFFLVTDNDDVFIGTAIFILLSIRLLTTTVEIKSWSFSCHKLKLM